MRSPGAAAHVDTDERGASAAEYSLLAALVAAGLVTVVAVIGASLPGGFDTVSDGLGGAVAEAP